jgi:DNA-binding NarL/FixJ family response regulator
VRGRRLANEAASIRWLRAGLRKRTDWPTATSIEDSMSTCVAGAVAPTVPGAARRPIAREVLTAREQAVVPLLARGYSDRQIAVLGCARMASVHVSHVLAKVDVRSHWQVAERARSLGLRAEEPSAPPGANRATQTT